jgi:hypothetical protein
MPHRNRDVEVTEATHHEELFGDRRLAAKAYDLAMLNASLSGQVDLFRAHERVVSQAMQAAGIARDLKNVAAHPASITVDKTLERGSQTLSEDTTQNVLRQVGETLTQEISRAVMDAMSTLGNALGAELEVEAEPEEEA